MTLYIFKDVFLIALAVGLLIAGILSILIWKKDKTMRITYLRGLIQVAALIGFFSSLPLLGLWPTVVIASIIGLTLLSGRFFCGWICPLGLYMDFISFLRKRLKIRYKNFSETTNRSLHKLRYFLVASVLALPFFFGPLNLDVWRSFLVFQGQFKPLIVFFLGPLEPLVIPWPGNIGFDGYSLSFPYVREIVAFSGSFAVLTVSLFVGLVVFSSFFVRRFWCRFCPTGVSIAAIDKFKRSKWAPMLHINKVEEKCTKCGICKRVCPVQVTEVYEQKGDNITTSMCMLCLRCVEMCPYEDCLRLNIVGKTLMKSRNWLEPSISE